MRGLIRRYQKLSLQVKAAMWYMVCNILQKGIAFIAVPLYTRILTTEQYGVYSVFLSWLQIFEIIATFGLSWDGYMVGLTKYEQDRKRYTSSMQCLSISLTATVFGLYLCFRRWINVITGMTTMVSCLMFLLLFARTATSFWTIRKRVEYKYVAVVTITLTSSILVPVLGVFSALHTERGEYAIIGATVLVQGMIGIVMIFINCYPQFTFFNKEYWGKALAFSGPLLPYYFSTVLLHSSDRILIQHLVGQSEAGIYSVAYSAAMVMQLFNSAVNSSMQPWLYKRMKDKSYYGVSKVINISLVLVAGLNLLLIALAPEAIAIMAPLEYRSAIWVVPPLAGSVFVMFFYQYFVYVELYYEESKLTAKVSIGAAILNLVLNFALIPVIGYLAAGYTTLASYLVFAGVHYKMMKKVCKKNGLPLDMINIKQMLLIMAVFFGISGILMIGYWYSAVRYATIIIFVILLLVFRGKLFQLAKMIKK